MTRRIALAVTAVALVAAGCHIRPRPLAPTPNEGSIISREDIAETGARTMWEALQRTVKYTMFQEDGRGTPERVRRRGASSIVLSDDMPIFVDNVRIADVVMLSQMNAVDIEYIQALNGVYATTYYGTNAGDGVILIFTKEAQREVR